ncbi:MAG TPA: hypothetical protein VL284_20880 [Thermoanaerobaculia bacterium]|nr:hypothetical protein [Thermoanaerobaculia bacterium]
MKHLIAIGSLVIATSCATTPRAALHDMALDGLGRFTTKDTPALRVGKISIHSAPLFDADEANRGVAYRVADALTVRTPEALIRRFLLFREGEEFDQEKLTESERNLRTFDFLAAVTITAEPPHDGVVDIDVNTRDAFTTEIDADFSNDGGRSLYDVSLTQLDLFGRGDALGFRMAQKRERRVKSIEFTDPARFGRYWNTDAMLAKNSDGNEERLSIERPLFSSFTDFTASALTDHLLQTARIYQDAAIGARFRQQHREVSLMAGSALATGSSGNFRVLAGIDFLTDTFTPDFGVAPDNRRFRFVQLGFDSTAFDLIKEAHVDFGLKEQDFNLGPHASADIGYSPTGIWRIRTVESIGHRLARHSFVVAQLVASTRGGATNRNTIVSGDTKIVLRFATTYPAALVSRIRVDIGSRLDRDVQFFADGQNGLRAYPNFAFEGSRRVLLNLEQRVFLGREVLQIFEPGVAIFLDNAWLRGEHADAGAGVRFAIPRYESAIIRIDAAYAFTGSPISRRGMVISVATTQAF